MRDILIDSLAVHRASRLLIEDKILERPRDAIFKKHPPHKGIGYLLTCYWCTGLQLAVLARLARRYAPNLYIPLAEVLAISSAVGIAQHKLVDRA